MLNWWGERSEERLVSEDSALSITFQKGHVVSGELLIASHCARGLGKSTQHCKSLDECRRAEQSRVETVISPPAAGTTWNYSPGEPNP